MASLFMSGSYIVRNVGSSMVEVGTIERKQLVIALLLVASLTLSVGVPVGNVPLGFGIGIAFGVAKLVVEAVR